MLEDSMAVRWSLRGVIRDTRLFRVYTPVYAGESVLMYHVNKFPSNETRTTYNNMYICDIPAGKVHDSDGCPDGELTLFFFSSLKIAKRAPQLKFAVISRWSWVHQVARKSSNP